MNLKRTSALSTAIALALYANPQPLLAQNTTDQDDAENTVEEVVVVGIRRSIVDSIDAKR
ncbi:MAG: hypothetical protein HRU51_11645, partial [Xanthomonadales bacterium]|nr:hypothetical protein [Xanthomonadales bacterium]